MSYTSQELVEKLNEMSVWAEFKRNLEQPARMEISGGAKLIVKASERRKSYMAAMVVGGELEAIGELYTALVSLEIPLIDDNGNPYTLDSITDELETMFYAWLARAHEAQNAAATLGYELFKGGLPELPEAE